MWPPLSCELRVCLPICGLTKICLRPTPSSLHPGPPHTPDSLQFVPFLPHLSHWGSQNEKGEEGGGSGSWNLIFPCSSVSRVSGQLAEGVRLEGAPALISEPRGDPWLGRDCGPSAKDGFLCPLIPQGRPAWGIRGQRKKALGGAQALRVLDRGADGARPGRRPLPASAFATLPCTPGAASASQF